MTDNFDLIRPLLVFPKKDSFYFVQVLQRKKDYPGVRIGGSNNNSRLIKAYYLTSQEKLDIHREELIKLAEVFKARICINLNPRSFEKAAFHVLQKIADQMSNGDFYSVRKAYDSVCGNYHAEMDKRWLIDIDKEELPILQEITDFVQTLHSGILNRQYGILANVPSRSGVHLITNPFNMEAFTKQFPTIEVHKNNPTSLYIPDF